MYRGNSDLRTMDDIDSGLYLRAPHHHVYPSCRNTANKPPTCCAPGPYSIWRSDLAHPRVPDQVSDSARPPHLIPATHSFMDV